MKEEKIVVGKVRTAHGLLGSVKMESFTEDPKSIFKLTPFFVGEASFSSWDKIQKTSSPHVFIVSLASDRDGALVYRGEYITVDRALLPFSEEEVYYADLMEKPLYHPTGEMIGYIKDFYNFGAGDILEVETLHQKKIMLSAEDIVISPNAPLIYKGDPSLLGKQE